MLKWWMIAIRDGVGLGLLIAVMWFVLVVVHAFVTTSGVPTP